MLITIRMIHFYRSIPSWARCNLLCSVFWNKMVLICQISTLLYVLNIYIHTGFSLLYNIIKHYTICNKWNVLLHLFWNCNETFELICISYVIYTSPHVDVSVTARSRLACTRVCWTGSRQSILAVSVLTFISPDEDCYW